MANRNPLESSDPVGKFRQVLGDRVVETANDASSMAIPTRVETNDLATENE